MMASNIEGHPSPPEDVIVLGDVAGQGSSSQGPNPRAGDNVDADTEIRYIYLTFETPLPVPDISPRRPREGRSETLPTPEPDLTPYANPLHWPSGRKNLLLALSCVATLLTAYTAGSYAAPVRVMAKHLDGGADSQLAVLAGITAFCMGFALAPMVLAPLSEINGRYPVFVVSGVVYVAFQAVCGAARSLAAMLVARLLTGIGGSVFSTMVGGVIADMWTAKGRNTPMALFSGSVLVGTGLGPLVGAVFASDQMEREWRWVFWHQAISSGVLMVALVLLFKESRGSILLSRKARALNAWYEELEQQGYYGVWVEEDLSPREGRGRAGSDSEGTMDEQTKQRWDVAPDEEKATTRRGSVSTSASLQRIRWRVKSDEERASIGKMISISLYRPFHLLFTEPVVFFFSLWVSFAWGVLYLTFSCIPLVFETVYGFSVEQSGRVFVAMIIGSLLATPTGILQERLLRDPRWNAESDVDQATLSPFWLFLRRRLPTNTPESRLYFTCISATLLPVGLYIFGLAARPDTHWMGSATAVALATMGIFSVYLATFNYLADVYQTYASSALAAQSCCRNVLGGIFPLITGMLFKNLGPPNAGLLLGSIAVALTLVPWVLVLYGARIRARSRFAMALDRKT